MLIVKQSIISPYFLFIQEPRCRPRLRPRPPQGECLTSARPSTSSGHSDTGRGSTGAAGEMLSGAMISNFTSVIILQSKSCFVNSTNTKESLLYKVGGKIAWSYVVILSIDEIKKIPSRVHVLASVKVETYFLNIIIVMSCFEYFFPYKIS